MICSYFLPEQELMGCLFQFMVIFFSKSIVFLHCVCGGSSSCGASVMEHLDWGHGTMLPGQKRTIRVLLHLICYYGLILTYRAAYLP